MDLKLVGNKDCLSTFKASDEVFARDFNEALIHQVTSAFRANLRSGTRAQKDRSAVKHSTKKPWRQKGTGRARAGMISSPLWRGGGRTFPNSSDENFSQKINKKMYRAAICIILSQLVREDRLLILEKLFQLENPKTKEAYSKLQDLNVNSSILIISDFIDTNLYLGIRNIPNVSIVEPCNINPINLIFYQTILITKLAVSKLEEIFR
ncbi:MAG: 50S ribosomal protein L4 [Bordetella sp.]|nr:MAG: 50S ribosomal protein L4 [Bordetella sp.]